MSRLNYHFVLKIVRCDAHLQFVNNKGLLPRIDTHSIQRGVGRGGRASRQRCFGTYLWRRTSEH